LKYKGGVTNDNSLIYRFIVSPFCAKLVKRFPTWIAPNLMTLMGLICNILAYIVPLYYASNNIELPSWVCFFSAFMIFTYMILDNCDGKQAFRTGNSTPLGELFDHGCDSLSIAMGCITTATMLGTGARGSFAYVFMGMIPFYLAHWQEYFTNTLECGMFNGPTEAECLAILIHILTGIGGSKFWNIDLKYSGYEFTPAQLVHWAVIISTSFTALQTLYNGTIEAMSRKVSLKKAYMQLLPILSFFVAVYFWHKYDLETFQKNPNIFLLTINFVFAYLTINCIIQRICQLEFQFYVLPLLPLLFASLCSVLKHHWNIQVADPQSLLYTIFVFYAMLVLDFIGFVMINFTEVLNIRAFQIKWPNKADQN